MPDPDDAPVRWVAEERTNDQVTFRIGRKGGTLVAEFVGTGRVIAAADGSWSRFEPAAGTSRQQVLKLERGLVRALAAHASGQPSFHASAVACGDRAIMFIGAAGAGKSTVAAELCTRRGAALLADDAVILRVGAGSVHVVPTEDAHWLLDSAAAALGLPARPSQKARFAAEAATEAARLVAVCKLAYDDAATRPTLARMHGRAALSALADAAVRFVVDDPERQLREFDQLAELAALAAIYELRRPGDLGRLAETGDLLEALLAESVREGPSPRRRDGL